MLENIQETKCDKCHKLNRRPYDKNREDIPPKDWCRVDVYESDSNCFSCDYEYYLCPECREALVEFIEGVEDSDNP